MKKFTSEKQKIGEKGEKIAEMFLVKHGFTILERNYTRKSGEIDIIAEKNNELYFIEVKTIVSRMNTQVSEMSLYHPFQNINQKKIKKTERTIYMYTQEKKVPRETHWYFSAIAVQLPQSDVSPMCTGRHETSDCVKNAKITFLKHCIL